MVIYGVTLLVFSFLLGLILGEFFGYLLGIDANLGGRIWCNAYSNFSSNYLKVNLNFEKLVKRNYFLEAIYIPIVVAMAAKQNVIAAIDGGMIAIIGGSLAVFISFNDSSHLKK